MKTIIANVSVNKKELQFFMSMFSKNIDIKTDKISSYTDDFPLKAIYWKDEKQNKVIELMPLAQFIISEYNIQHNYNCKANLTLFKEIVFYNVESIKYRNKWFKHKITNCVFYVPFDIIDESDIIDQVPERSEHSLKETDREFYDNLVPLTLDEIYIHMKNSSLMPFYYKFRSLEEKDNIIDYLYKMNDFKIGEIKHDDKLLLIKDKRIYGLNAHKIVKNVPIIDSISVVANIIEISPYHHSNYMIQEKENKKYEFFKGNLSMVYNIKNIRNPTIEEMIKFSDLPF